ncbi:MAG: SWIM zinc finger domain-containing protein [Bacilli bacterium]|nr:SWIM zinc finger domain-containing protein [Bacilli bacterium]MDD4796003.1 SWIM zinc finger domain-containing protein [Bacilli bacterium]
MRLINIASNSSTWRGLDYYKEKNIVNYKKISDFEYSGIPIGSNKEKYNVFMDMEHPRKSKCNCPHAKDKRIICKHIVALYFTVFPSKVDQFLKEVEEANQQYEEYEKELYRKTIEYINNMSKSELQKALVETLNYAPEWLYERFVRNNVGFQ